MFSDFIRIIFSIIEFFGKGIEKKLRLRKENVLPLLIWFILGTLIGKCYSEDAEKIDVIGAKIVESNAQEFRHWRELNSQRDSLSYLAMSKYFQRQSNAKKAFWSGVGAYVAGSLMVFGATYGSCSEKNHSDHCLPSYLAYPIGFMGLPIAFGGAFYLVPKGIILWTNNSPEETNLLVQFHKSF